MVSKIEQKLIGQRWGKLVAIGGYIPGSTTNKEKLASTILCICDCGSGEKRYSVNNLRGGYTKSCGCFRIENSSKMGKINGKTGGLTRRKYSPQESSARDLFQKYMKRNPGNLNFDEFFKLTQMPCYYCCDPPQQIYLVKNATDNDSGKFLYNGLDRINNSKGYDSDNVRSCCGICNFMRHDLSIKDFYSQIIKIFNHKNKEIKTLGLMEKLKKTNFNRLQQIPELLKFVLTLDDDEITKSTIESVIEVLEEEIGE